jgi:hypothetical protein
VNVPEEHSHLLSLCKDKIALRAKDSSYSLSIGTLFRLLRGSLYIRASLHLSEL